VANKLCVRSDLCQRFVGMPEDIVAGKQDSDGFASSRSILIPRSGAVRFGKSWLTSRYPLTSADDAARKEFLRRLLHASDSGEKE